MAEHTINFVEGKGVAIQATVDPTEEIWEVEIANSAGGQLALKGDLLSSDEEVAARLAVGMDGQVLSADSTAELGLAWADPAGGDPASDSAAWMPLFDSDGLLVLDDDEGLIPTLTPLA